MPEYVADWTAGCVRLIAQLSDNATAGIFVDSKGHVLPAFENGTTWGITSAACYTYCGPDKLTQKFNFETFSSSFTNWLLPWLALVAQLPYETHSWSSNLMSACLALGSPALITYSLSLTIFNRAWIRRSFAGLFSRADISTVDSKHRGLSKKIGAAQNILQEAQQVPLRLSQELGWLSSLIVIPSNLKWWERVNDHLHNTRRGVTYSLVAQISVAIVSWLFTVISSFQDSLGSLSVALQMSAANLWIWMIPVICGWIIVGTQSRYGSISNAFQSKNNNSVRAVSNNRSDVSGSSNRADAAADNGVVSGQQKAFKVQWQLTSSTRMANFNGNDNNANNNDNNSTSSDDETRFDLPRFLGFDVVGDERLEGPIFNYARVFTGWQVACTLEKAFDRMLSSLAAYQRPNCMGQTWEEQLRGDNEHTAQFCGLSSGSALQAYPKWSQLPANIWHRMFGSAMMALLVQWGTTGAALMMAYNTPTIGLGCRSGAYLIYGVLGTISWILSVISMLFSHAAMLRYQHLLGEANSNRIRVDFSNPYKCPRTLSHTIICGLAVFTRLGGRGIALCNGTWLLVSSLFEYTGFYETCWCLTDKVSLGDAGWTVIYKGASDLAQSAESVWIGGILFSCTVCVGAYTVFHLSCRA